MAIPSQVSATSQGPAAARHSVPPGVFASSGQAALEPVQVSATSHGPAAARQTTPAFPAGCWHAVLSPSHWSTVQTFPSSVQAVPARFLASSGQLGPLPVQSSATSHSSAAARQCVVPGAKVSAGHAPLTPSQASATSQGPAAGRHVVPSGVFASAGQLELVPVQVSAGSQTPLDARHTAPALPAGCWHFMLTPSQTSAVHGLPSSTQPVPLALHVSAGHSGPSPVHVSGMSHSPAPGRHTVLAGANPSAGQSLLAPSQVSATSQGPAAARQTLPAAPFASAGQVALEPVQTSGTSHGPPAVRQTVPEATKVQLAVQHAPPSHCSPRSTTPLPQFSRYVAIAAAH